MRKTAFEVSLERTAPRLDEPRAVVALGAEQKLQTALIDRIAGADFAGQGQGYQDGARRVGVALEADPLGDPPGLSFAAVPL